MVAKVLLCLVKESLLEHFSLVDKINKEELLHHSPFLAKEQASFVTLHKDGALRGCIGSIIAHRSLYDDIVSNTLSAAFGDSRFTPLAQEELSSLDLEISVLTPPEEIIYSNYDDLCTQIVAGKDGLILQHAGYQGTFLPQVWEQLPHTNEFLEQLSYKAGGSPEIYALHPKIYRYRVEAIKEAFDAIPPI